MSFTASSPDNSSSRAIGCSTCGDEDNADIHGRVPGYAVVDLDGALDITQRCTAFVQVDNLFDRRYATFGTLGQNVFTAPARSFDPGGATWRQERSSGAPRGSWLGVTWLFGKDTRGNGASEPG